MKIKDKDTILITGADGFLGSHLVDYFVKDGSSVYGLKNCSGKVENLSHYTYNKKVFSLNELELYHKEKIKIPTDYEDIRILECDLRNSILLETIIKDVQPKYLFHFGAQPYVIRSWENPNETIETNVIGTINIFEPIKKYKMKTKVIVACSSAEYGTTTEMKRALKETDPLLAVHPYGISKIATELLARQYFINFGIECVNLRFFNQTGPRKVNDACSDFTRKIAQIELDQIKPIIYVGNLKPYRDITGIRDSLQAVLLATVKGRSGETYNVCSNRKVQIREVLDIILSFSKKNIKVVENTPNKLRSTDEDIILGDNGKIKSELGFTITQSIEEILRQIFDYWIEFYRKEKKIN